MHRVSGSAEIGSSLKNLLRSKIQPRSREAEPSTSFFILTRPGSKILGKIIYGKVKAFLHASNDFETVTGSTPLSLVNDLAGERAA